MSSACSKWMFTLCKLRLKGPVIENMSLNKYAIAMNCFVWKESNKPEAIFLWSKVSHLDTRKTFVHWLMFTLESSNQLWYFEEHKNCN